MVNFNNIVSNILFEQPRPTPGTPPVGSPPPPGSATGFPPWFQDILKKHKSLGLGEITEADVIKIMPFVFKSYLSRQDISNNKKGILILDILRTIYDVAPNKPKAQTLEEFFNSSDDKVRKDINALGEKAQKLINSYQKKEQWEIRNGEILRIQGLGKSRIDYFTQAASSLATAAGAKLYG